MSPLPFIPPPLPSFVSPPPKDSFNSIQRLKFLQTKVNMQMAAIHDDDEAAAAAAGGGGNIIPPSHFNPRELAMMNHMVMVGGTSFPAPPTPTPNSLPFSAADSGLTTTNNMPSSRKRSRDDCYPFPNHSPLVPFGYRYHNYDGSIGAGCASQRIKSMTTPPRFEQEAALLMQRELDSLIAQHRLRAELLELARQQAKALASAIRGAFATKLREKEEEIQRVAKLNWGLQERVRSLCAENQLWMGLAQSNEAAANSLRTDLERVLAGTTGGVEDNNGNIPAAAAERGDEAGGDAESCCGSNEEEEEEEERRRCKVCEGWLEETSEGVVMMPCRHVLMQCKRCNGGSSRQSCPVCGSQITATLHVHLPPN
ncbi:hypothetical protein MLD38_021254 [Melastoma candidum]|uniref:Uncharacterized protein n=1 Tax=Melastoma candidum TaxID=119954 RepID=A0ACB9QIX4_9MYRT|nr:hypothetical protein MLD38_021254 [Melastoma candidum]